MLANSFRQLSRAAAGRALVNQSTTSFANLAPFATAAGQPSDPKTVLAILYKAGSASEEKRLLGTTGKLCDFATLACMVVKMAVTDGSCCCTRLESLLVDFVEK